MLLVVRSLGWLCWAAAEGLTWLSPSHLAAGLISLPLALPKSLAHPSHAGVPGVSWSCSAAVAVPWGLC